MDNLKLTHWPRVFAIAMALAIVVYAFIGRFHSATLEAITNPEQSQDLLWCTFDVSPNAKKIIFSGVGKGGLNLYLLDMMTNKVTRITKSPGYENYPAFSPDGKSIVYQRGENLTLPRHLFLRSLQDNTCKQLTNAENTSDDHPYFSSDGKQIVFARATLFHSGARGENTWSNFDIYKMHYDGSLLHQLTHLHGDGVMRPKFYPNNQKILFERTLPDDPSPMHLASVNTNGQGSIQEVVRFGTMADSSPYFYPDGKHVVFCANSEGRLNLCTISLGSNRAHILVVGREADGFCDPVVTSDGKNIYCVSAYNHSLWKMNADGTGLHQIADSSLFSDPMHWKPTVK